MLRIGGNAIWGEYFSGLIDEVRIYNRALTPTEIQTDMNTPVGSPERLLGEAVAAGDAAPLSQQEIRPLFDEAVTRWSAALGDAEAVAAPAGGPRRDHGLAGHDAGTGVRRR